MDVVNQALIQVGTGGEVGSAGQSAGEDEHVGIEEVNLAEQGVGLHADAVGAGDGALTCDRNDLQVEACTADDVGGAESLNLLGAGSEE